ncbi:hypothetical protein [Methylobacterium gnaphalii]|uniref:Uncharacterized protein n=1 Tax=Methylobacterium gnaphalii TaxID=1010610 RepID=A0A512JGG1_9HYPH|nr:hypothetical protein [Methylobacterium gnaphalii]GEP09016.1 hypothetical protein MGN01_08610 [Methylobacterium gnaphalii]GJD67559.1 hypothetical protein MMMDOFMJ_0475 [Methylobacterium gnaphalii]GLS48939.1 hypothetical protein GCM10007885_17860 [Methylobacterium gnaphalii]
MPRLVSYSVRDRDDGRFDVVVTMEPDRTYLREGLATLAEVEEWVDGLRALMTAIGAPVAQAGDETKPIGSTATRLEAEPHLEAETFSSEEQTRRFLEPRRAAGASEDPEAFRAMVRKSVKPKG